MSQAHSARQGFVELMLSPLTLLPIGSGLSLLILAWVLPANRQQLLFASVAVVLAGLGFVMTRWLFFAGDPQLTAMREEFVQSLAAACRSDSQEQPQEAKLMTAPAPADKP